MKARQASGDETLPIVEDQKFRQGREKDHTGPYLNWIGLDGVRMTCFRCDSKYHLARECEADGRRKVTFSVSPNNEKKTDPR